MAEACIFVGGALADGVDDEDNGFETSLPSTLKYSF
jgi:hypothetical protein